jgi:hypothetical protein
MALLSRYSSKQKTQTRRNQKYSKVKKKRAINIQPTDLWTQETGFNVLLKEMLAEKTHHLM